MKGFRADFIQPEKNEMIRRGRANRTRMNGEIKRCL